MSKFWKRALLLTVAIGAATFFLGAGAALIGPSYSALVNTAGLVTWFVAMYKNAMKSIDENNNPPPPPSAGLAIEPKRPRKKQYQHQRDDFSQAKENPRKKGPKNLGKWGRKSHTDDYQRAA